MKDTCAALEQSECHLLTLTRNTRDKIALLPRTWRSQTTAAMRPGEKKTTDTQEVSLPQTLTGGDGFCWLLITEVPIGKTLRQIEFLCSEYIN